MLSLKNVSFVYDKGKKNEIDIIDDFSYEFEKWKIYALFWKSWLWKSTLARIISWFLSPLKGTVALSGNVIVSPSKDIIYISQKDDIFYRLTVYENLYLLCHDVERVEAVLKKVDLIKNRSHYPKHLSWWMLKRLSFARVFLLQPRVLILDEPFVYLDEHIKATLIKLLLDIHQNNKHMTTILISHDVGEIGISNTIISFDGNISNAFSETKNG